MDHRLRFCTVHPGHRLDYSESVAWCACQRTASTSRLDEGSLRLSSRICLTLGRGPLFCAGRHVQCLALGSDASGCAGDQLLAGSVWHGLCCTDAGKRYSAWRWDLLQPVRLLYFADGCARALCLGRQLDETTGDRVSSFSPPRRAGLRRESACNAGKVARHPKRFFIVIELLCSSAVVLFILLHHERDPHLR